MTREDLIKRLTDANPNLSRANAKRVVHLIFDTLAAKLVDGGKIELRGFGSFFTNQHEGRVGHDPRTGGRISVPTRRLARFKVSKALVRELSASKSPLVTD